MPDCYTHSYIASQALIRSGQTVASRPAFLAGANGPDVLYVYRRWKNKPNSALTVLASRMHREKTGKFLNTLVHLAITPVQQSYALGFLTHYTSDCTLYPFIGAMCNIGAPYHCDGGRQLLEASMDSTLYYKDYKTYLVPVHAGTPVLITEDLAQVSVLLHETVLQVFGLDIPPVDFADTFHDNLKMREYLFSKNGFRKAFVRFKETFSSKNKSLLSFRMQPAPPLKVLPDKWKNPFTNEEINLTFEEVVALAEQTGAAAIIAAMKYWLAEMDEKQLADILGDNNYFTGLHEPIQEKKDDKASANPQEDPPLEKPANDADK